MIRINREVTCEFCGEEFFKDSWTFVFDSALPDIPRENKIGLSHACNECVDAAKKAANTEREQKGIKWEVEP
jgi:hypothetical protein